MDNLDFKDLSSETRQFTGRALLFWFILILLVLGLAARMFYLQLMQHDRFAAMANNNRIMLQPIPPNRGLIYDANGVLLAKNTASRSLNLTPERIEDLDQTIESLRKIVEVSDNDVERYSKLRTQSRRPYESLPLRLNLSEKEIAQIAVNSYRLPGVSVEAQLVRHYPLAELTAHVLGYVSRINEKELKRINPAQYRGTQNIGKLGIEKFYEHQLLGRAGYQKVEINARGRVLRVLESSPPSPGADITLYLDSRLQKVAEGALGDRRGAIVAIDPETGGILAMVSTPSFDTNLFVTGIDNKTYGALRDSPDLPLFNRALRGQYPPGSTMKPFVALAALNTGNTNWQHTIHDPGWYQLTKNGRFYRDWKKYGHGKVDLKTAIVQSCDTFFYEIAHHMEIDDLHDFLVQFGFGSSTALDIAESLNGILPSRKWKKKSLRESWYTGDSLNVGIGQGYMLATPLQLAIATAVLANRGKWVQPRLMKSVLSHTDQQDQVNSRSNPLVLGDVAVNNVEHWSKMIDAMESVVHGKRGTAKGISKGLTYRIAGKTGTAQVIGIKQDEEYDADLVAERNQDHGLFVAFAPVDKPKIAIAVIVENGGGGSTSAAPVARKVMDAYLLQSNTELAFNE